MKAKNISVLIYEPSYKETHFEGFEVTQDLAEFNLRSDVIVANRITNDLTQVMHKVISRDIFKDN
mgnify:CR=1 FL=1